VSTNVRMPAVFFGHGNPMNALETNAFTKGWSAMARALPRPKAILAVSAHWYVPFTGVTVADRPRTIHDFGGFPKPLYDVQYRSPGSPELAARVRELLRPLDVQPDERWGLDHGTWSVLVHVYPEADVPIVQLSIDETRDASWHFETARKLAPLRDEGVLIIGSGTMTHNLSEFRGHRPDDPPQDWVERFAGWFNEKLIAGDTQALVNYRKLAPDAVRNHPTDEHLLPIYVALGAAGENARAEQIHSSSAYAIIRMDAYAFETAGEGETRKVA